MSEHIKIGNITPRVQYIGDGETLAFEFSFPIFSDEDLEVYFNDSRQTQGYTIQGTASSEGGSVTFESPPASGVIVTLRRHLSLQRLSDFQDSGKLRARILNDELDYQTAALQQIAEGLGRAVQAAPTSPAMDLTFPDLPSGSFGFLRFDGTTRSLGFAELSAAGVTTRFRDLSDTPNSYEGDGGKVLAVNEDGTGSIVAVSLGAVALDIDGLGIQASIEGEADTVPMFDRSAGINTKVTPVDLVQAGLEAGATLPVHAHTAGQVSVAGTPGHGLRIAADNTIESTGKVPGSGDGGVTDHGALTGLADDDHTQYHTDARGDARYYVQGTVDAALAGKADSSHTQAISTITGLQTALDGKAASSHTHPLSQIDQSGATSGQVPKWNGSAWAPADESGGGGGGDVASVFGRTGAVVAQADDYTAEQVSETSAAKIMTSAERTKLSGIATGANNYSHPNHAGDVTSMGDGATTISAGAVTYAKMQNVTAGRLLGRGSSSGSGSPQELTLGANITMDDGVINVSTGTATLGDGVYGDVTVSGSGTVMTVDPAILGVAGLTRATYSQPSGAQTWPTEAQTAKHWIVTMATDGELTIRPDRFPWTADLTEEMLLTVVQPNFGMRQPVIPGAYATPHGGVAPYFREAANSRTTVRFWRDDNMTIYWDGWAGSAGRLEVSTLTVADFISLPENAITATNQIDNNARTGSGGKLVTAQGALASGVPVVGGAGGDAANGVFADAQTAVGTATLVNATHTFITGAGTYTLPAIGSYGALLSITNRHSETVSVSRGGTDTITLADGTASQTNISIPAGTTVTLVGGSGVWNVEAAGSGGGGGPVTGQDVTITPFVAGNAVVLDAEGNLVDGGVPPGGVGGTTNITVAESPTGVEVQSSSGTNDSIALATTTNAGVMAPADKTKLDGIEAGATADQSNAEIEAAYNAQVAVVGQAEAEAGAATTVRRWTAQRVRQAIEAAMDGSGGGGGGKHFSTRSDAYYPVSSADLGLAASGILYLTHVEAQVGLALDAFLPGQSLTVVWTGNIASAITSPLLRDVGCTIFPPDISEINEKGDSMHIECLAPNTYWVRFLPVHAGNGLLGVLPGDPPPPDPPGDFTEYFHPFNQGGTTLLTHPNGTRYAEGLSGVKKALIVVAATFAHPDQTQRQVLAMSYSSSFIARAEPYILTPWADTDGGQIGGGANVIMFDAPVPNNSRAHLLLSIDNEAGSYRFHQLLFREAQGFARANATFRNCPMTGTDKAIRLQDVVNAAGAHALVVGAGDAAGQQPHVGGIGRVTIWPGIAPDLSALTDTDVANLWNLTTGALVAPALAYTVFGTPALDLVGTRASDWTNQAGAHGIWGNMVDFE